MAVVVLPTPPFWFAIAITWVTGASPRISMTGTTSGRSTRDGMAVMLLLRSGGRMARLSTEDASCSPFCGYVDRTRFARIRATSDGHATIERPYDAAELRAAAVLAQRQSTSGGTGADQ